MEILAKPYWACIIKNMVNKKCLVCHTVYKANVSNRKFCSMSCFHKISPAHKKGKESPFWKGSKAGYGSIHDWIKSMRGMAYKCENPLCVYPRKTKNGVLDKPYKFDWALKKGRKYTDRKIDSFMQLCRSCHKQYDYVEKQHTRNNKGIFI